MDKREYADIGKRIQTYRIKNHLTQEYVAEKVGISQKHLSRIEQGYHNPRFDVIIKIAHTINVSVDALSHNVDNVDNDDIDLFFESIRPYIENFNEKQRKVIKDFIVMFSEYNNEE